ncbi:Uncharacterized protein TCM_017638 [Theobroma cacao]|uniref:Uncharacterized protein n=1 Tax=Theobroma cacao TaxID=3641 RepID=A0A061EDS2_THECC|nr:Uncharacterized protein TCM_017638 [Theobroma cacao]
MVANRWKEITLKAKPLAENKSCECQSKGQRIRILTVGISKSILKGVASNHYRGKRVPFDNLTINKFYNISEIENDGYAQYVDGNVNLDELIMVLYKQAGVQWSSEEELLHPKAPLDPNIIHRLYEHSTVGGSSTFALRPPPRLTKLTILQRLESLQRKAVHQEECLQVMEQMLRACTLYMSIDMTTFPYLPKDPMTDEEKEEVILSHFGC